MTEPLLPTRRRPPAEGVLGQQGRREQGEPSCTKGTAEEEEDAGGNSVVTGDDEDDDDDDESFPPVAVSSSSQQQGEDGRVPGAQHHHPAIPVGITIAYYKRLGSTGASAAVEPKIVVPRQKNKEEEAERQRKDLPPQIAAAATRTKPEPPLSSWSLFSTTPLRTTTTARPSTTTTTTTSWQVFVDSALIYIVCLILPSLLGYAYQCYTLWRQDEKMMAAAQHHHHGGGTKIGTNNNKDPGWSSLLSSAYYNYYSEYLFGESSLYQWFIREVYEPEISAWCDASPDEDEDAAVRAVIWSYVSYGVRSAGLCPAPSSSTKPILSVFSDDLLAWSDSFSISIFSFFIAAIRIAIVHFTVPLDDSVELEAMVRCKSMHLLSSDYVVTPVGTPLRRLPRRVLTNVSNCGSHGLLIPPPLLPSLDNNINNNNNHGNGNYPANHNNNASNNNNNNVDENNNNDNNYMDDEGSTFMFDDTVSVHMETIGIGGPQQAYDAVIADDMKVGDNNDDDDNEDYDDDEMDFDEQLLKRLAKATTTTGGDDDGGSPHSTNSTTTGHRMYAGPRYATALFRLTYSTFAAIMALYYFRTADFWPWYVFGHGRSVQCWDLSGGLAVAVDSDFDRRNVYLKRYFLWQASYHWHSAAFHILSMLILLLHPTKHAPRRFLSLQKGTTLYLRRLLQHALAVALIGIAYIFSSLRRLGAIGLFAFDVSSCCLHLLQLCINAPTTTTTNDRENDDDNKNVSRYRWSFWRRRCRASSSTIARLVFWLLVVPSFVLARFCIWPAIWYSATFESGAWLGQLERTLWPGSAALIRYAIHGLMAALQVLSAIYFHRLFHHDHVRRVLQANNTNVDSKGGGSAGTTDGTAATPRRLFASKVS